MMAAEIVKSTHRLHSLLQGMTDQLPDKDVLIKGLSLDSRNCQSGDLFMACAGTRGHGLLHAADAARQGAEAIAYENDSRLHEWPEAVAALDSVKQQITCVPVTRLQEKIGFIADRFFDHPSSQQFVVGITGTNGKTSCS